MNILQVISKLDASDAADDVLMATRFLTLNGHKVIVSSEKSALVKRIDEVGARHYAVPLGSSIFFLPISLFKLMQIIVKENIRVVHARDGRASLAAFFASRFTGRSFVSSIYGKSRPGFLGKAQFWAKRVVCSSESQILELEKKGFISQTKAAVVPPAIDAKRRLSHPAPEGMQHHFTIGVALSSFSQEGMQNFIRSISMLSRTIHKIKVFIVDKKSLYEKDHIEKLKLLIRRHSLAGVVSLEAERDTTKVIARLNLFVQINTDEKASPRLLLEAASRGVPTLTTPAGWLKEYVKVGKTAFVTKTQKPQEIASGILDLYRNEKLRKELAQNARDFVKENFNPAKTMELILGVYREAISAKSILIIKVGALGDVILATPSVVAIRKKFPKAKIKILIGINNRDVFANSPLVNELIVCDFNERDKGLKGLLRIASKLRTESFDIVVDFQNNKKSHMLSFLSCAPERYGYDNGKFGFLLNRKVKDVKFPLGPVEHQSKVLGLLGIYNIDKTLKLWPTKEDDAWAESFLKSHWIKDNEKLLAIGIGSSSRWQTKLWPVGNFIELSNKLAKNFGIRTVLIGHDKNDARTEEFLKRAKCKPINAAGTTNIPRLAALVKK
ncbi:glycosyltransferase, partial [Candidatus Omnitrophota bacterium]